MDQITVSSIFSIGGKIIDKLFPVFLICFLCFDALLSTTHEQSLLLATLLFAVAGISLSSLILSFLTIQELSLFARKRKCALRRDGFELAQLVSPTCNCLANNPFRYLFVRVKGRQGIPPCRQGSYRTSATCHTYLRHARHSIYTLGLSALCNACTTLPILCKSLYVRHAANARALCFSLTTLLWTGTRKILSFRIASFLLIQAFYSRSRKRKPTDNFQHKTGLLSVQSAYQLGQSFSRA